MEYLWGWSKCYFREHSNGKFSLAKSLVPISLNACPLVTIWRFFHHSEHYISVYSLRATGIAAEYAVKKYKSHQGVSQRDLNAVEEERMAKATALQRFSWLHIYCFIHLLCTHCISPRKRARLGPALHTTAHWHSVSLPEYNLDIKQIQSVLGSWG
jgi:hypothetical protein